MGKLNLKILFLVLLSACTQEVGFQTLDSLSENEFLFGRQVSSHRLGNYQKEVESFKLFSQQASIDFLILPDSSKSMLPHLENLGKSLSDLLYVASDYDWQMGFSSVDHGDYHYSGRQEHWKSHLAQGKGRFGTLMKLENGSQFLLTNILSPKIKNYEKVFLHTLSHTPKINCQAPPFCSSPMEQPLRSLKSAIERAFLGNRGLFRSSSQYFVSILISNEEERKEDPQRATSPEEVISVFNKQFQGLDKKFLHYSIVVDSKECLRKEQSRVPTSGISQASIRLSELTAGPGAVMSLCSENFGSSLRVLSQHIKNKVENSFFLKKQPIPSSVELVFSKGVQIDWTLKGREILFDNENFKNIEGIVSYQALK